LQNIPEADENHKELGRHVRNRQGDPQGRHTDEEGVADRLGEVDPPDQGIPDAAEPDGHFDFPPAEGGLGLGRKSLVAYGVYTPVPQARNESC